MKRSTVLPSPGSIRPISHRTSGAQATGRTADPRRRPLARILALALVVGAPGLAHADSVTDWNEKATEATKALPLPVRLRAMAMVQIAVHDALNAIDRRYRTYSVTPPANMYASPEAAVATAAHEVLAGVLPAAPDDGYDAYIDALPPCPAARPQCLQDGVAAGMGAAAAILADRSTDDLGNLHPAYTRAPAPGVYQPTPGVAFAAFEGWADIRPFALRNARQFRTRPSQLLNLRSWRYTYDYYQVKHLGSITVRGGANEQSEESRIAKFWYGSGGQDWFATTRAIANDRQLDTWQNARLFALLAMGQVDATISVFYNKYKYAFWRPVTAIRWANDGNPFTVPDPNWSPYLVTPPYPDYPCGVPIMAGAGTEVLRNFFRSDNVPYTVTSTYKPPAPGTPELITRSYRTLTDAGAEAAIARVYAGIHFSTGCVVGEAQGEQIGHWATRHYLRPYHRHQD